MTDKDNGLADKIEQASEGSRELDAEIAAHLGLPWDYSADWRGGWGFDDAGKPIERPVAFPYTTSLDAAMTLVPEGWAWAGEFSDYNYAAVWLDTPDYDGCPFEGRAKSPALAICAAALRARKETD